MRRRRFNSAGEKTVRQLITLTTDFGTRDWFVGAVKGVIFSLAPRATIVDVTHEISPGDIRAGAFALAASCGYFPKGTVHVVVVDPGVGSARRAIAVQTERYFFVGPDNGVLSFALARQRIKSVRWLTNKDFFLETVSHTFHGRDVFAPVAAHLSLGLPLAKLGPPARDFVHLRWPEPKSTRAGVTGEIVYLDRFGNAITNLAAEQLRAFRMGKVFAKRRCLGSLNAFYAAVPPGHPTAVIGSSGLLEIAVNGGSAARALGLRVGDSVRVSCGA